MTDRLMGQIQEFAEENNLGFEMIDNGYFTFSLESVAGVEVLVAFSDKEVNSLEDIRNILFEKSMSLDVNGHICNGLEIYSDADIESIINTYHGGMDEEEFSENWEAIFGEDVDIDRAIELRDDAYDTRGKLDKLATAASEKYMEIENTKEHKSKNKDKGLER